MSKVYRPKDLCSQDGALKNVALIREYWWERGYTAVDVWPVRLGNDFSKKPVWGVQSNLLNGRPA